MEKLKEILKDNEWKPLLEDRRWKKRNKYFTYPNTEHIGYTIDNKLIKKMKQFNSIYKTIKNKKHVYANDPEDKLIERVYKIESIKNPQKYIISITAGSVLRAIKISIHRYLLNKTDEYNYFTKLNLDPTQTKVTLLAYIKRANKKTLNRIKEKY